MKKQTRALLILTGGIFVVLAALLAARFTPGSNPVMHKITILLLSPAILVVKVISKLRFWPFSEKTDVAMACLLGGLALLTAFLYATVLISGVKAFKKLKRSRTKQCKLSAGAAEA